MRIAFIIGGVSSLVIAIRYGKEKDYLWMAVFALMALFFFMNAS